MNKVKLGDVADIVTGPFGSMLHKDDYAETGTPVIMPQDIGDRTLSLASIAHVGSKDAERLARYATISGDIVYARRGDIEKHAFITEIEAGALCGTGCLRVRVDRQKADPLYISFALNGPFNRAWIRLHAVGSNMPNINTDILSSLPLELPSLEEQKSVAALLSAIDDKIALNKKMMVELEDTARLIYDYWFTQFDFPDENGRPYRSSGGKMVYNETLKCEIPEGWEAGTLSSLAAYGERSIDNPLLTTNTYVSTDNMLPNRGGVSESQYLPDAGSSSMFERHDILLSNIRPYFKKIWLADRVGGCCNDVLVLHPTNINDWAYLYWIMESDIFFAYDTAGAKGSKMPRGDKDHIMRYPFALPSAQLRASFAEQVSSLMTAEEKLQAESAQLTALRDWLLPMLMNGQVSISG